MNQVETETFISGLPNVQRTDNFGYAFFFVGSDHRIPFVTIASSDNEFDNVSHLDREGIFRLNIGVRKETFRALFGQSKSEAVDYSKLNVFMPHPHYSRQHFICILNPADDNAEEVKRFVMEAHSIAEARRERKPAV